MSQNNTCCVTSAHRLCNVSKEQSLCCCFWEVRVTRSVLDADDEVMQIECLICIHQVLFSFFLTLKPLVEMTFRELTAPLTSNKSHPQPVIDECLRMTDFSSDPLLECALRCVCALCCGAIKLLNSIKLCVKPVFFPTPPSSLKWTLQSAVLPLGRMAGEGQFKFRHY